MRRLSLYLLLLVLLAVGMGAGSYALTCRYLERPHGGDASLVLTVTRGTTLRPLLHSLGAGAILLQPDWLYAYARLSGRHVVRSGTYAFTATQSPAEILAALQAGRVQLESLTLPEGLNRWQMRALLSTAGWMSAHEFDDLCDDQAFLAVHQVPGPSCEGYLFPETYKFARGVAPSAILATMFVSFQAAFAAATTASHGPLALDMRALTTLASIVEKETGRPSERPRIACVFYNRLRGQPAWRLETDPTVIYAATLRDPHFDGNLTRQHLRSLDSPYNTYRVTGLPPGPIANPGRAALAAVAHPDICGDFFFVANNQGGHIFCPTLTCHNAAVQHFQVDYFRRKRLHEAAGGRRR